MSDLTAAVDAFEQKHREPMTRWRAHVDPDSLDGLIAALGEMQAESEALTARIRVEDPALYRDRWAPLLLELMAMIPDVQKRLAAVRGEARSGLGLLDKGQRGLTGYRRSLGVQGSILDSDV